MGALGGRAGPERVKDRKYCCYHGLVVHVDPRRLGGKNEAKIPFQLFVRSMPSPNFTG